MSEQFMSDSQINVSDRRRAVRLTYPAVKSAILEPIELKELSENEVLVQSVFSGVSRGTERLVFEGNVPPSEWQRMRCPHQFGDFSFPVTYGYASVGKVIAVGNAVHNTKIGDHVFALHPHQDLFIVEDQWVNVLPKDLISPRLGVLTANMETALNANWDAEIENTDSISVIGGGVVGLLTAFLARELSGSVPTIIDINPEKQALAEKFGFKFQFPEEVVETARNEPFECTFHTSASEKGLQLATDIAKFEGRIIEMSWYGNKSVNLNLGGAFHSQRLSLISSQVGHVSATKRNTYSHSDRMKLAMKYINDPIFNELLFPVIPFSKLPDMIDKVLTSNNALCPLITHTNSKN